jgi:hypothetical protein
MYHIPSLLRTLCTNAKKVCTKPKSKKAGKPFPHVCLYVHTYVCMYILMYVCTYLCMYVHTYVCMYILMYVCTYLGMYVHTYVCMYIHMYIHMYRFLNSVHALSAIMVTLLSMGPFLRGFSCRHFLLHQQRDRMRSWKNRPKCSPTHFLSTLMHM